MAYRKPGCLTMAGSPNPSLGADDAHVRCPAARPDETYQPAAR